jgi:hypothetical protein
MIKKLTTTEVGMLMSSDTIIRDAQVMVKKCMIHGFKGVLTKSWIKGSLQADRTNQDGDFCLKIALKGLSKTKIP